MRLEIPADVETFLQDQAKAAGFSSAEEYALTLLKGQGPVESEPSTQSDEQWRDRLRALAARHQPTGAPLDDSRESIYD